LILKKGKEDTKNCNKICLFGMNIPVQESKIQYILKALEILKRE